MRQIFDVRCNSCSHVEEVFGKLDDTFRCSVCASDTKRIISPVRCKLEGMSGDFPGAAFKWQRQHEAAGRK